VIFNTRWLSSRSGAALIDKGNGTRARLHVIGAKLGDSKSPRFDQIVDLSVQVAAASEVAPNRSQKFLPANDAWVWRPTTLGKYEFSFRLENAAQLTSRGGGIADRAQREGHDDRTEASIVEGQLFT
jgi:hypothetical protein